MELDDARAPVELLVVEELGHELLLGEDEREGSRGGRAQAWMCEGIEEGHGGALVGGLDWGEIPRKEKAGRWRQAGGWMGQVA